MAKKFIGHVMPEVIRPIHILWNQVIGFFFIVLAILPLSYIIKDWSKPGAAPRLAYGNTVRRRHGWIRYPLVSESSQNLQIMSLKS